MTNLLAWEAQRLDPAIPAVLTAHVSLNTARTSSEQSMLLGRDPVLMQSALAQPTLDYVALGHIHKHQVLSTNPYVVYSGSLERVDFGEEDDEKGFCVIDVDAARPPGRRLVDFRFQQVKARRFLTIPVSVTAEQDPTQEALKAIARRRVDGAIVRVRVEMPQEVEAQLRENEVRSALASAQFVTPIVRDVTRGASHAAWGDAGGGAVAAGCAAAVPGDGECAGGEGGAASELRGIKGDARGRLAIGRAPHKRGVGGHLRDQAVLEGVPRPLHSTLGG